MKRGKDLDLSRIRRAYRVRLELTVEQRRAMARYAAGARVAYNWALAEWRRQHRACVLAKKAPDRARALLTRWGSSLASDPRWGWRDRLAAAVAAGEKTEDGKLFDEKEALKSWNPEPNAYALHATLTAAKRGEVVLPENKRGRVPGPWIGAIPALVLREAVADVGVAYEHFFRRLREGVVGREAGEPRFRRYADDHARFHVDQGSAIQVRRDAIRLPIIGWVKFHERQRGYVPIDAKICGVGVSRHLQHWYAAVRVETGAPTRIPNRKRKIAGKKLGVEVGVRALVVMSDGRAILDRRETRPLSDKARAAVESHERRLASAERRLAVWQRRMARRHKPNVSSRDQTGWWHEAKDHVQRLYAYIARVRDELLHYASRRIVDTGADTIMMREPAVKSMIARAGKTDEALRARNRLAPKVHALGWFELRRKVEYKQAWSRASAGRVAEGSFVLTPPDHPTSRTCSVCGAVRDTEAAYPTFVCPSCGHREDRDDNAAKVLRDFAPSSDGSKDGAGTPRRKTARKGGTTAKRSGSPDAAAQAVTVGSHGDATSPLGSGNGALPRE